MKIKKVDDKPLVIHTMQKAKLRTHEPKQASIKGSNIYTVDRDPTKKNKDNVDLRKSICSFDDISNDTDGLIAFVQFANDNKVLIHIVDEEPESRVDV